MEIVVVSTFALDALLGVYLTIEKMRERDVVLHWKRGELTMGELKYYKKEHVIHVRKLNPSVKYAGAYEKTKVD
jgi:hypothetical protein